MTVYAFDPVANKVRKGISTGFNGSRYIVLEKEDKTRGGLMHTHSEECIGDSEEDAIKRYKEYTAKRYAGALVYQAEQIKGLEEYVAYWKKEAERFQ